MSYKGIYKSEKSMTALWQTVIYSDLFDFPLTESELWYLLKSNCRVSKNDFLRSLEHLPVGIQKKNKFYCLIRRIPITAQRLKREEVSKKKFRVASEAASWLSILPTIYLIAISGSVASGNAAEDDDIDFFIIVKKNTLWMSRLAGLILLQLIGMRRSRTAKNHRNKICINMILDESAMALPEDRRDIYTAHEIAQLKPLIEKNKIYQKFLKVNSWLTGYMPNSLAIARHRINKGQPFKAYGIVQFICNFCFWMLIIIKFEVIARYLQLWLINKHRTTETVSDALLAFHPVDYRQIVLSKYHLRLQEHNIG